MAQCPLQRLCTSNYARERSAAYPVRVDDRVEASGDNGSAATEDPVLRVRDRGEGGEGEELGEHGVKTVKRARNV